MFNLITDLILTYGLAIYIQRIGDRNNDIDVSDSGRYKFFDLFYAFKHPIYPYTVGSIINRWQYQFFIEHEIETVHNPHQDRMYTPSTEVLFIGLSYALLVVNLKFNIFCLDYFDHDV